MILIRTIALFVSANEREMKALAGIEKQKNILFCLTCKLLVSKFYKPINTIWRFMTTICFLVAPVGLQHYRALVDNNFSFFHQWTRADIFSDQFSVQVISREITQKDATFEKAPLIWKQLAQK